jgi:hypothetical protein
LDEPTTDPEDQATPKDGEGEEKEIEDGDEAGDTQENTKLKNEKSRQSSFNRASHLLPLQHPQKLQLAAATSWATPSLLSF